jgi:ABC-type glycerol-3-phosphate transport system permease component
MSAASLSLPAAGSGMTRKLAITAAWTVVALLYLFPYTWMVMTGVRNPIDTLTMPPKLIFEPTLSGILYLFRTTGFQSYLAHSAVISIVSVAAVIALSAPAAYALAHISRGRSFLLAILVTRMVPGIAIAVPVYLIASDLDQLDTYQAMIIVNTAFNIPFAVWLMRSFFAEIHPGLREAAIVDGCSELQVFLRIMVPLVLGGIFATAVFVFIAVWNEFLFAVVLANTKVATAPVAMLSFRTQYGIQWDAIGAAALLISTPVIAFALVMQRYLVKGLTLGSVK